MTDKSRDIDEKVAKVLGWTNLDWHFDRTEPMRMWLGGTPPGIDSETGWIEEIPEYSNRSSAMREPLQWLSDNYDYVVLESNCGYWAGHVKELPAHDVIAFTCKDHNTPMLALCELVIRVNYENERT